MSTAGKFRKPYTVKYDCATHGKQVPQCIVLHDTESHDAKGRRDITGIFNFWRHQGKGYGAHYVIDAAGNIGEGATPKQVTYAVAGANTGKVHIELIGFAWWSRTKWQKREAQLDKTKKLIAWLSRTYNIPLTHSTVRGVAKHADFPPPSNHTDPGKNFPFREVLTGARWYRRVGWGK